MQAAFERDTALSENQEGKILLRYTAFCGYRDNYEEKKTAGSTAVSEFNLICCTAKFRYSALKYFE